MLNNFCMIMTLFCWQWAQHAHVTFHCRVKRPSLLSNQGFLSSFSRTEANLTIIVWLERTEVKIKVIVDTKGRKIFKNEED